MRGQERARRALELAAAGGHNLLLGGPPGTGKTMLARRLPGILPRLPPDEALEVTRIHSVAGLLPPGRPLVSVPPFRAPHHTASVAVDRRRRLVASSGRGEPRAPRGALPRRAGRVPAATRSRRCASRWRTARSRSRGSAGKIVFPARFQLVATMNLCPCGARGDPRPSARARRRGWPRTATSSRGRCSTGSTSWSPCRGRAPASSTGAPGERSARGARAGHGRRERAREEPLRRSREANELLEPRRRAAAAVGARPRPRRARRSDDRAARRR